MTGRSSNEDFVLEIMNIEFFGKYSNLAKNLC